MIYLWPRVKQGSDRGLFLLGFLRGLFLEDEVASNTKRPGMVSVKKFHAAKTADQVVEPEAGCMIQTQVIDLVIGVVPRPSRITPATSDRVGSCGAKLLNGFEVNTSGEAGLQLPFRFPYGQNTRLGILGQRWWIATGRGSAVSWRSTEADSLGATLNHNIPSLLC